MGEKFGCSMEEAENVLRIAAEQGHSVVGVAFHVGSHTYDGDVFKVAIGRARKLFDVGAELGIKMSVLDIGGGFPGGVRKTHSFMQLP
ncbi:hypothetical protein HPB48_012218 [Haemaphysalis longicornis]|uniref:Orn/DAP/Arg decarboxylase 2 N-terminal domain-containing protein n=1 Tax=Haemaphysalis longicornis TaxID=44386 RepID=A0A9J6FW09_HAELO|nr:hypothetical protein HPB48_012218 [Haemaphysalis longicornis]